MKYKLQFNLLILLSIADFFITRSIVGTNMLLELNPIAAYVIGNFGYIGLLFLKALPILLLLSLLIQLDFNSRPTKIMLNTLVCIYAIVVIPGLFILL